MRQIRRHWPSTHITLPGDGHHGRPEVMTFCEAQGIVYIIGLPANAMLRAAGEDAADNVRARCAETDPAELAFAVRCGTCSGLQQSIGGKDVMHFGRRTTLALAGSATWPGAGRPQTRAWPTRSVRIIIPYAPGGPVEIPGRFIAEHLTQRLGQSVIVETRPGAGGAIGTKQVIAAQDDHLLLMATGAIVIQPAVQPDIGYDPVVELSPISLISESTMAFAVRPNARWRTLQELLVTAQAEPGRVSYGSSGNGTTTHMAAALFGLRAKINWLHVPYRGGGQLINAFLAGDVDVISGDLALILPHAREGRARVLGVTGRERFPALPEVPSIEEIVPGTAITIWFALFGSRSLPQEAADRLVAEMASLRTGSPLAERMAAAGGNLLVTGPDQLAAQIRRELPMWRQVVAEAGIRPE